MRKREGYGHTYRLLADKQSKLWGIVGSSREFVLSLAMVMLIAMVISAVLTVKSIGLENGLTDYLLNGGTIKIHTLYLVLVFVAIPLLMILLRKASTNRLEYNLYDVAIEFDKDKIIIARDGEIVFVDVEDIGALQSNSGSSKENTKHIEVFSKAKEFICLLPNNEEVREYFREEHGLEVNYYAE